ncbi:MAG: Rpn family recombination-promoting nuclease/putative transposase [Lachnospiraceae bacterium]|jgi:predicted transposase/invertase (TIGR01784 family)|nr:Rpn family recombination-promoting nuclease/putative transposase [Lachnospiraceae bacterium]MBR5179185.1 Rpn family recombination-promoting nuclease/putative transposase [Lachnospiraceae bacterium]MCR4992213.1 Rpn family recombination-promoting nuclease/putative transposase [Lachnospiraceae bacterium]
MGESKKRSVKKPFEALTIADNYMFQSIMRDKKKAKPLLEMVLRKKIKDIIYVEVEKTKETGYRTRGIRMDVYIEDDEKIVYDIEMQGFQKPHFGKRFRYYQSAMDVDVVNKGDSFGKLRKSYIIFFTCYDPYGKGWYMYPFKTICEWDSDIVMDDEAERIVMNVKGYKDKEGHEVSEEIKELLSYMDGNSPKSDYTKMLDEAVKEVKQNEERRSEYMSINTFAADEREMGEYRTYVEQIRGNDDGFVADDVLIRVLRIPDRILINVRKVIKEHPDWDDEEVAEEVLALEA